jgi:hypothetical protein
MIKSHYVENANDINDLRFHHFVFSDEFEFGTEIIHRKGLNMNSILYNNETIAHAYLKGTNEWNRNLIGYRYPEFYPINTILREMAADDLPILFVGEYPETVPFAFVVLLQMIVLMVVLYFDWKKIGKTSGYIEIN